MVMEVASAIETVYDVIAFCHGKGCDDQDVRRGKP